MRGRVRAVSGFAVRIRRSPEGLAVAAHHREWHDVQGLSVPAGVGGKLWITVVRTVLAGCRSRLMPIRRLLPNLEFLLSHVIGRRRAGLERFFRIVLIRGVGNSCR